MRSATWLTMLLLAAPAAGQETTVWLTILGEGGAEEVTIGPEGGLVPYWLFAETDPPGTPANFGLGRAVITIDTDLGVPQQPASEFGEEFMRFFGLRRGIPADPDDIIRIGGSQPKRPQGGIRSGLARGEPLFVARGDLIVPRAGVGTTFHASILVDFAQVSITSWASIVPREITGALRSPDHVVGNALTIHVIEPVLASDIDGDGDVDLADFLFLASCFGGPGEAPPAGCKPADLDGDGDVDLADILVLQAEFTGSR